MSSDEDYLRIARIVGVHGLHGRLKIYVISDIDERFLPGNNLYIKIGGHYKVYRSAEFIMKRGKASFLKLDGIASRDDALLLKGCEIFIKKSEAEKTRESLGEDVYYYYDLIGSRAFWNGDDFAEVVDIIEVGDGNALILKDNNGREYFIPFIQSMVDTKSIDSKRIDINPVDGLFEV